MSLFKLASKGIRLIRGGSKAQPKTYGTLRRKRNAFKGVESPSSKKNYGTMRRNKKSFKGVESAGITKKK